MLMLHLVLLGALATLTRADSYPECTDIEPGSFLPSSLDCTMYIYCDGENSMIGACPDNMHFSVDENSCLPPKEANCKIGSTDESITTIIAEVATTTTKKTTTEAPKTTTTTTTPMAEPTDVPPTTTEPATTQSSVVDPATLGPISVHTIVSDSCPNEGKANEVVLVASKQSCSLYYLCQYGQAIELRCSQRLHFNPNTGMCDFPNNVGCSLDRPSIDQCLPDMTDFFPHAGNCNYFYFCIKGFLTLQQCPFSYGWDVDRRSCVLMSQAKCFQNSRRGFSLPSNNRRYL